MKTAPVVNAAVATENTQRRDVPTDEQGGSGNKVLRINDMPLLLTLAVGCSGTIARLGWNTSAAAAASARHITGTRRHRRMCRAERWGRIP